MNKSFQDILNDKIGKQHSSTEKIAHASKPSQSSNISYELLVHLNSSLSLNLKIKTPSPYPKAKVVASIKAEEAKKEIYGYFCGDTQEITEAKLFFAYHGYRIGESVSSEELKRSFRKLALKLHPDTENGSQQMFMELSKNNEILQNSWRPFLEAA